MINLSTCTRRDFDFEIVPRGVWATKQEQSKANSDEGFM